MSEKSTSAAPAPKPETVSDPTYTKKVGGGNADKPGPMEFETKTGKE